MPVLYTIAIRTRRGEVSVWAFETAEAHAAALALLPLYGAELLANQPEDLLNVEGELAGYLREHHGIT